MVTEKEALSEQEVLSWFAEAGQPNPGRDAILCLWSCVSVAKARYEWKMKNGKVHPALIANANEANAAAKALKTIQRRLKKLEHAYQQDGESLPGPLARLRDVIEDEEVRFHLSPINPDFISRYWWKSDLDFLRSGVIHALQLAGRNAGDGNEAGPVPRILAQALEFIDGDFVLPVSVHSRLKELKKKKKQSLARS